jgi:hypothetical protein
MATAIFKSTLKFENDSNPAESHKSTPDPLPVEFPDWVTKTELYALAKKDGSVIEVNLGDNAPTSEQLQLVSDEALYAEARRRGNVGLSVGTGGTIEGSPRGVVEAAAVKKAFSAPTDEQLALLPDEALLKEYDRRAGPAEAYDRAAKDAGKSVASIDQAKKDGATGNDGQAADIAKGATEDATAAAAKAAGKAPAPTDSSASKTGAAKSGDGQTSRS